MKTPIEQAIEHIQANLNGIGIILNESRLSAKEKSHYTTNAKCLKITKEYLKTMIPIEKEYSKQIAIEQRQACAESEYTIMNTPLVTDTK